FFRSSRFLLACFRVGLRNCSQLCRVWVPWAPLSIRKVIDFSGVNHRREKQAFPRPTRVSRYSERDPVGLGMPFEIAAFEIADLRPGRGVLPWAHVGRLTSSARARARLAATTSTPRRQHGPAAERRSFPGRRGRTKEWPRAPPRRSRHDAGPIRTLLGAGARQGETGIGVEDGLPRRRATEGKEAQERAG